jgi:hypothetical protein
VWEGDTTTEGSCPAFVADSKREEGRGTRREGSCSWAQEHRIECRKWGRVPNQREEDMTSIHRLVGIGRGTASDCSRLGGEG